MNWKLWHDQFISTEMATKKCQLGAPRRKHQPLSLMKLTGISLVLLAVTSCAGEASPSKTTNTSVPISDTQSNSAQTIQPQNQLPTTSTMSTRNPSTGSTDQGQPTPGNVGAQLPIRNGDVENTLNSGDGGSSNQPQNSVPAPPPTTATTMLSSYTPFACIARLVPTLSPMPAGKKAVVLRVSVTEGRPKDGWWRLYFGREIISGSLTFDSVGNSESSTLTVNAGSTVYAEIFASAQFLSSSIACEAETAVAP